MPLIEPHADGIPGVPGNFQRICLTRTTRGTVSPPPRRSTPSARKRLGGVGNWLADQIADRTGAESRAVELGHIQRGGTPTADDRAGHRFRLHALDAAHDGDSMKRPGFDAHAVLCGLFCVRGSRLVVAGQERSGLGPASSRARPQHHLQGGDGSYLSVAWRPTSRRTAGTRRTRTAHLGPDNDEVTSSAQQLAVVVAVTVVVMLLVFW